MVRQEAESKLPPGMYLQWSGQFEKWIRARNQGLLRTHGWIKKIFEPHRYLVTAEGRTANTAILAARKASPRQLATASEAYRITSRSAD